jgi:N-acetylneuraminate synthase
MSNRVFVIAEAGVNHNGSLDLAVKLVEAAADAGADAVKFQTFKAENLVTRLAQKADYQASNTGTSGSQFEMLRELELKQEDYVELKRACDARGIEFMSTPFDEDSLQMLVDIGVMRLKLSSGEITNAPLLHRASRTGLPIILSTGMASLGEVKTALSVLVHGVSEDSSEPCMKAFERAFCLHPDCLVGKVTLLHCTTDYPCSLGDANLRAMDTLSDAFNLPVGLSDHTEGAVAALAAVARGALVLEKHLTLDRSLTGPDHLASMNPDEFSRLVQGVRNVELVLGSATKTPVSAELKNIDVVRKSLVASTPIRQGDIFTEGNVTAKRPGSGVSPLFFWDVLGKVAPRDYKRDEILDFPCNQ